jgi:hypothetical protein
MKIGMQNFSIRAIWFLAGVILVSDGVLGLAYAPNVVSPIFDLAETFIGVIIIALAARGIN